MNSRNAALLLMFMLSHITPVAVADILEIAESQLDNIGVSFDRPEVAELADDFEAPAQVRIPPTNDYAVVPLLSGTIKRLGVSAGDSVSKGESIAWVGSPDFLTLQGEYIEAYHQTRLLETRFTNDRILNDEGIVSTRRLSESEHEVEDRRVAEQRLHHSLVLAGLEEVEIIALRDSLLLQPDMVLRSPVDGIVLEEYSTAGQLVDPSQAVFRVADLSTLWLEIDVPFLKSRDLIPGATVLVKQEQRNTTAKISNIGRNVNPGTQTVVVRAVIENPNDLAPGQFVTALFTKLRSEKYLLLAISSVVRKDNQDYVFVKHSDGVEVREVEVVRQAQGRIIIGAGIDANDSVAIRGTAALKARWLGIGGGE